MWPSPIFFPGGLVPMEVVCQLQGSVTVSGGSSVIPTPTCFQEGDIQIIAYTMQTNNVPNYSATGLGTDVAGGDWIMPLIDTTDSTSSMFVAMRRYVLGHTPWTVTVPGGTLYFNYVTYILRGAPAGNDLVRGADHGGETLGALDLTSTDCPESVRVPWHPDSIPLGSLNDAILAITDKNAGSAADFTLPPVDGSRVRMTGSAVSSNAPGIAAIHQTIPDDYVDLFGSSPPLTGWTGENVTITEDINDAREANVAEVAASTGIHGIYRDATLVAGRTYFFNALMTIRSSTTGAGSTCFWMTVEDPSAVIHGCGNNQGATVGDVHGTLATQNSLARTHTMNASARYFNRAVLRFTPDQSGVHRFRISSGTQADLGGGDIIGAAGNATRGFDFGSITLVEAESGLEDWTAQGWARRNNASFWDTPTKFPFLAARNTGTSRRGHKYLTIRGSSAPRLPCRMGGTLLLMNTMDPDGRTLSGPNDMLLSPTGTKWFFVYSDHIVGAWLASKFYFEVTVTTTNDNFGIGVALPNQNIEGYTNPLNTSSLDSHWYGQGVGTARNGTVTDTAPAAWINGDVIGVLLNFTNFEITITQNGTLWKTWAMPSSLLARNGGWKACFLHSGDVFESSTLRYAANFTGPFSYKPAGSVAFDFDNEVP